ncbi:hypothetical protein QMK19_28415 [Streptomyces sp. H10-C2]|nr:MULTISPECIES: hypothetical protein [unclassified Streptomyces]MDJ0343883.1 hypothetical protein [Streptomyces sp. PH10-H1]MDJ0373472.1 hypothetical protein [Streptomyces sp. H10-C2]
MNSKYDWETGDELIRLDDPAEVGAAFERGEPLIGTAVIGLVAELW